MQEKMLHQLAKTELHCHLDGSLSLNAIRQLAEMAQILLPACDEDLCKLVTAPAQTESLLDYLTVFDFIRPLLQTKEALKLAAYDVVAQAAKENVLYMEIRFAPELSRDQGLTALETVEAVLEGVREAEAEFGIVAKVLVCGLKQSVPEQTHAIFKEVVSLAQKGLAGFDFAGNEADFPTQALEEIIQETQNLGLPMTFHAGECGCVANVARAVQLGIPRIGHATALIKDRKVMEEFINSGATIEMCLTSNLQTGAAPSLADFPYQELYDLGANITINTDNRTVSATNLTKEYSLFVQYFGASKDDFYRFNQNAIRASFTTEAEKERLLKQLELAYDYDEVKRISRKDWERTR
ncbi:MULTISPECIES: adenosine deaminase [unclassified Streptococcus]|uniref:adenosine deaminase n=1 Tax=unclassified Streptococcus TaxID=2608887 RepID=UPI0010719341|nr:MULTISPECIES: adenosine deaminase [unclassified Streptococcus]MBF0786466.1 adenosine deaminase [Streptococcus sp. 19428wC2_LYSM12]MCQ9212418.1 adenosine deaminase [Streptococcus sp. B01]MCQ9213756.1 adenosine deaminase [Streptococcus sp. O1]TFV06631.1 adenosine deaminase [Streptococcus sp. LYSM12]